MQCKKCSYRLWNLRSRRCPECGEDFVPSDFDFVPNSTRFLCPHCGQDYYGTNPHGHLTPKSFNCVRCSQRIDMDEMILLPAEGVDEKQTRADVVPWLERESRGTFRSWFATIGQAMTSPGRLIRAAPGESKSADAWWFAIVTSIPINLLGGSLLWFVFLGPIIGAMSGSTLGIILGVIIGLLVALCGAALITVLQIAIWGGVTHGLLRVTGDTRGSTAGTYQAICYASGANILTGVPCFGPYFGWIWWLVSAIIMVKEGQNVATWRAVLAVLTLPVIGLGGLIVLYGIFIAFAVTAGGPFAGIMGAGAPDTHTVVTAVNLYMESNDAAPPHALALAQQGQLDEYGYVMTMSDTYIEDIRLADITLDMFPELTDDQQAKLVDKLAATLPDNTVAHRLGDFVFFDIGDLPTEGLPIELWLIAGCDDPDITSATVTNKSFYVGQADGSVRRISSMDLQTELGTQNELRKSLGLAPIPDPRTVHFGRPAVADP